MFLLFNIQEFMSKSVSIDDFTDLHEIGHGAIGKVYRAKYKKNKRIFALKKMSKAYLHKQNMIAQVNTEIKISLELKHENIINVHDCIQDEENIYLVLELAENGQLYEKLRKVGRFDETTAKAMIRDVVAAVEYLHSRNPPIIHRDIKPENLLLDKNNRIKLADFGWSAFMNKPRKTYCGTIDYLAPEMIDQSGHDEKLDIWCIGVLVYELLTGRTPFQSGEPGKNNQQALYDNILNVRIEFPSDFPILAKSFIMGLIKRNPKQRMSIQEMKNHPWLKESEQKLSDAVMMPTTTPPIEKKVTKQISPESQSQSKTIKQLSKKIREQQQEIASLKMKMKEMGLKQNEETMANSSNSKQQEITKLMNEVRKLKIAEQMNEKYKKQEEKMWDEINMKDKEIIKLRTEVKKSEDIVEEFEKMTTEKNNLSDKAKRLQKQLKEMENKNKELKEKIEQADQGIAQRVKNGQHISLQEINSPEFLGFLQEQIIDLAEKFQASKAVVTRLLEKERKADQQMEQLARYRSEEKKMREIIKAELREVYENEKDDLLLKARTELGEEKQKWLKQREQLRLIYEDSAAATQSSSVKGNREQDLQGELRNVRELNEYYEKTIKKQKLQLQDLREQLKRAFQKDKK